MTVSTRRQNCDRVLGVTRADSDDELGIEDHPWEWILDPNGSSDADAKIIGARMGTFICHVGDTVLLKADGLNEAWVAMICEFLVDEDREKSANFMWFSSEREIRNRLRKRMDFMQNELYITPSWDVNPLTSINGHASVMSPSEYTRKFPTNKISRPAKDAEKAFVCRRGCNTRTATYSDDFVWEDIFTGTEDSVYNLIKFVKTTTTGRLGPRQSEPETDQGEGAPDWCVPPITSQSERYSSSKKKKQLTFTPLATRTITAGHAASSYQLARARLHVSAVPMSLPCREKEFQEVYARLTEAIADSAGNCFYISGTPGTGKTATVREVVSHLERAVQTDELEDFIFVEINGMKLTDPYQSYSLLWEALRGQRVSPSQALDLLEREFNNPSPRRVPCVVLMDELDQLVTKNQGIMYNFFNWPSLRHSKLIVLAVANTMDLPERTLSNKISSRLGLTRVTFPGYTHEQLMKIIQSRLDGVAGDIVEPDAIQFASRKVAAVSGDARRALDICRRAVELAEASAANSSVSGEINRTSNKQAKVSIATIMKAINEATSNPIQQHIRGLPLMIKVTLIAIVQRLRRTGIAETTVGDVSDEVKRNLDLAQNGAMVLLGGESDSNSLCIEPASVHCGLRTRAPALRDALLDLASAGIVTLESHRTDRGSKIRLAVGTNEIIMALKEDVEMKELSILIPTG